MLISTLADSNPAKMLLQKYRVGIIAAFAQLVPAVKSGQVSKWNEHAKALLVEASDAYVAATSGRKVPALQVVAAFAFFGVPEEKVDRALRSMYGYEDSDPT